MIMSAVRTHANSDLGSYNTRLKKIMMELPSLASANMMDFESHCCIRLHLKQQLYVYCWN